MNILETPDESGLLIKKIKTAQDGSFKVQLYCSSFKFVFSKSGYITSYRITENSFTSKIDLGSNVLLNSIEIELSAINRTAYSGMLVNIPFTITNRGNFVETISLRAISNSISEIKIEDSVGEVNTILLLPDSSINLEIYAKIPLNASNSLEIELNCVGNQIVTQEILIQVQEPPSFIECYYPSRQSVPNEINNYIINLKNIFSEKVEIKLVITGIPNGWTAQWINEDAESVTSLILLQGEEKEITLRVNIPQTTIEDTYVFFVSGIANGVTASQQLQVVVEDKKLDLILNARYPAQTIEMGDSVSFKIKIENPSSSAESIQLMAITNQKEWSVLFTNTEGAYIQSVLLDSWSEEYITMVVEPSLETQPGFYNIEVKAISSRFSGELTLTVGLIGNTQMALSVDNLYTQLVVGSPTIILFSVENTGYSTLNNVGLEADFSENLFSVEMDPIRVISLKPGEKKTFEMVITALEGTAQGDYLLDIRAISREVNTEASQIRVTVSPNRGQTVIVTTIMLSSFSLIYIVYRKYKRK